MFKSRFLLFTGRGDVEKYNGKIESLVSDFHNNGPGTVDDNFELGVLKIDVS